MSKKNLKNKSTKESNAILAKLNQDSMFSPTLRPPFPKDMMVELTNACNSRCIFCANQMMTRKVGHIDLTLLHRILHEARDLGVENIGLYTTGEPFISNKLGKVISMAKSAGFSSIYLTTNGLLATPQRMRCVVLSGLNSIKFSINAGTPETYKIIRRIDAFEKVITHLKYIHSYREEIDGLFSIYVSYIVIRQNQCEVSKFKDLVSPYVDDILFANVSNQGGLMNDSYKSLTPNKVNNKFTFQNKTPCPIIFNRFHVTYEGYLSICCVDHQGYLNVADLNKNSLKKAWHNNKFVETRRRHIGNDLEGTQCYNCVYNKNKKIVPLVPEYATTY